MDSDSEDEAPDSEVDYSEEEEEFGAKKGKRKPPARGGVKNEPSQLAAKGKSKAAPKKAAPKKVDPLYAKFQKAAEDGTLSSFKVFDLKEFLNSQKMPAAGTKAFLVDTISELFDQ